MEIAYQSERVTMYEGDCLSVLPTLAAGSVNAVICDPPYGSTACHWDSVIPLEPMWAELRRLVVSRGAVVMTASQPFTTTLISSNREWFRYTLVWDKKSTSSALNANRRPLKRHEDVCVFSQSSPPYNPQMRAGSLRWKGGRGTFDTVIYGAARAVKTKNSTYYPTSILEFSAANVSEKEHPTQKPVALMSYLIRTYTNEGDTVLDFCCGSGTTGVAALECGRKAILIEREPAYVAIAAKRLAEAKAGQALFDIADRNTAAAVAPSLF